MVDGWQVLVAFNNLATDDVTAISSVAAAGTPGRDGVTRVPPTLGGHNVWTDITQYVKSGQFKRGRQHELSRFESGTATLEVDNTVATFAPWNTSSPFTGLLLPMVPLQIRKVWSGTTYYEFTGYITAWPQKWPDQVNTTAEIQASDAFRMMSIANISSSVYAALVISTSPSAYYRLGDIINNIALDSSGNNRHGLYMGKGTQGVAGALLSDEDNAFDAGAYAGFVTAYAAPFGNAFTLKGWVKFHAAPSGSDRVFSANDGANQLLNIYMQQSNGAPTTYGALYFSASDGTTFTVATGANNTYVDEAIPVDGKYHQFVCTRDSTGVIYTIFIDGVQVLQATLSAVINLSGLNWAALCGIPININNGSPALNGALDEFSIHIGTALTPAQVLADYNTAVGIWAASDTGTRINNVLTSIGWPAAPRSIQSGNTSIPSVPSSLTATKALQYMQTVELTEAGALFMDGAGRVRFYNRSTVVTQAASSPFVFGDGGGAEFPFQPDPDLALDDLDIWNESDIQRQGGQTQSTTDTTSIAKYGRRTMPNNSGMLYSDDIDSLYRSQWDVERYKNPVTRMRMVRVRPMAQQSSIPALLGLELMASAQTHRVSQAGTAFQQNALIEGITHTFDAETGDWLVDYALSPVEARAYWVLGDTAFGVLGSTTRLRF